MLLAIQLGLLAVVIRQFQLESGAFLRIALLAFAGALVHSLLPLRYRLPFFLLLSFAGIGLVLGLLNGVWLVGLGLVLIGICHVPVAFPLRMLLLLLTGTVLAVLRMEWLHAPWSPIIWPILGSMFMFRLIVYLYDLRHDNAPVSVWRTLAYFFLLPNVCFPLFPVVDYKTFRRNYYNDDAYRIYQVGVEWMVRGLVHLILYRIVYYYFTLAPSEVTSPLDLGRYMVTTFLLYLRVSGQFHLIVGMLHLFGFHLPETNHYYCLASSVTDFWRRINIYWKDFMLKVFYYPTYFRLRALGTTKALVISTLFVFCVTWFLHSYQWFWLRGSFPLLWQDACFWGVLAVLVVINSLREAKYGRERVVGKSSRTLRGSAILALRIAGTFGFICVLWSLWTTDSFSTWASLWTSALKVTDGASLLPALLVVAMVLRGTTRGDEGGKRIPKRGQQPIFRRSVTLTLVSLLFLSLIGLPAVYSRLGSTVASVILSLRSAKLSRLDAVRLERGYYENLLEVDRFNGQLWEVYMNRPLHWLDVRASVLARFTGNFLYQDLIPSATTSTRYGIISTNRWGMRDQDYELHPAPGTYRMALLGASTVMGWGVGDGATFEALVEDRLNRERVGAPYAKYEILNFGVQGYYPPQQLMVLDKAFAFSLDAALYTATGREAYRAALYLAEMVRDGIEIPYDYLREIVQRAGVEAKMSEAVALRRLAPFQGEILAWLYRRIVQDCRERDVLPVWVFLPAIQEEEWRLKDQDDVQRVAEEAGFVVLSLGNVFAHQEARSVQLEEWDQHPNPTGHKLIAARLYEALWEKEAVLFPHRAPPSGKPQRQTDLTTRGQ